MRWPLKTHALKPTTVTKEHKTPRHYKGTDDEENLAAACSRCNSMRGHLELDVFVRIINKLLKVEFIRKHWHTTDPEIIRFIRKIFSYEVDAINAIKDKETAFRAAEKYHKYSLDILLSSNKPLSQKLRLRA